MKHTYLIGRQASLFLLLCYWLSSAPATAQSWAKLMSKGDSCEAKGQVEPTYLFRKMALKQAITEFGMSHRYYGETLTQLGILLSLRGQAKSAEDTLLMAQQLFQVLGPPADSLLGINYEALALLFRRQNRFADAETAYLSARAIWEKTVGTEHERYSATLLGLATVYQVQRQYNKAKPILLAALAARRKANDRTSSTYAGILGSMGVLYNALEQYEEAEPLAIESLAIRRKLYGNDHPSTATSASNLAILYEKLGDYDKALQLHREALQIRVKQVPGSVDHATNLQNMAICLGRLGEKAQADSLYGLALAIYAKSPGRKSLSYANTLTNRAYGLDSQEKSSEALVMYREALATISALSGTQNALYARALNNASSAEMGQRNYGRADSLLTEALLISDRLVGTTTLEHASYVANRAINKYGMGQIELAITNLDEAISIFNQNLVRHFLYLSAGQKEAYLARWGFNHPVYYSISQQHPTDPHLAKESYTFSLFVKNLLLNEHNRLLTSLKQSPDGLIRRRLDSLQLLKSTINQQYNLPLAKREKLDSLENQAERLEKELARQSAPFRQAQQSIRTGWKDVQKALTPTTAAVEFVHFRFHNGYKLTDSVLYMALVLRSGWNSPRLVPLTDEKRLSGLLKQTTDNQLAEKLTLLRARTQIMTNTGQLARGEALYKLIWQPIDSLLGGVKQVWVSPSGLLHNVSLAALPYPAKQIGAASTYLSARYVLRQVGSTRTIANSPKTPQTMPRTALFYGGVDYGKQPASRAVADWPVLPGTRKEVTGIATLWGASATVVTGQRATKNQLMAATATPPGVLHLATHGFFRSSTDQRTDFVRAAADPVLTRSGIVMAGANVPGTDTLTRDNGILTGLELANLNLSGTELVVLSACETGLGDIRGSEGVFGLQRAVKMAGAKHLLMSLWPVPDGSTSQFMTDFYRNWKKSKAIHTAFTQTQRTFQQQYPPAVWAAFVLVE